VASATEPTNTQVLWLDTTETAANPLQGSAGGNIDMAGFGLQLDRYQERVFALGNVTGTITPSFNNGSVQTATVTGNITLNSLANVATGSSMTLILTQDGTGGRALTSSMKWAGGITQLSTAASATDIVTIFYDGSTYYATLAKGFV
jgi:hypothetical protein